jgi:hypothetical protein
MSLTAILYVSNSFLCVPERDGFLKFALGRDLSNIHASVHEYICVCVCVCERERERERGFLSVHQVSPLSNKISY